MKVEKKLKNFNFPLPVVERLKTVANTTGKTETQIVLDSLEKELVKFEKENKWKQ